MTLGLGEITNCFQGVIPTQITTASGDGWPNVTYLSLVHEVDDDHLAASNQFFSKTTRNLAENPRASIVVIDPITYDQFKIAAVYERSERQGALFDEFRAEIDMIASLTGMTGVFQLRAVDIYRVLSVEQYHPS